MSASFAVSGLLTSSTGSALLRKVLFQVDGEGLHGQWHSFEKPWFTTWESAAACWISIVIYWLLNWLPASSSHVLEEDAERTQPLLDENENELQDGSPASEEKQAEVSAGDEQLERSEGRAKWREIWALSAPGAFSIISIIFQGMGLRYVSASVSMMLSGSCIIFTAVLSVTLLKCRLNNLHLSGVALTLGGILIVSVANLIWPEVSHSTRHHHPNQPPSGGGGKPAESGTGEVVLGISLTLLSMLVLAMRLVSEEFALRGTKLHPLQVLGYEGMWGTLGVGIVGLPLAALLPGEDIGGCQENTSDSFVLLFKNPSLNAINALFFLSVVGLNIFGLMVTSRLGSVFRAVLLTARTASVWAIDLILFYLHVGGGGVGEPWMNPASWFQLFGFTLLLLGTVVYAQGSSAVAQDEEQRKLTDDFGGADDGPTWQLSNASAVTRLRPYTSLYIPHGPRDIPRRSALSDTLERRALSLPQQSLEGTSPLARFTNVFHSHSYTPGLPRGSSPRSVQSGGSEDYPGPPSSLFVQTLTHRSSWVLPNQGLVRATSPSILGRLAEEGESLAEQDNPFASSSPFDSGWVAQQPPATVFGGAAQAAAPEQQQPGNRPRPGQSPSPQNMIEYRRQRRKSGSRMAPVEESDAEKEALRASIDERVRRVSGELSPARGDKVEYQEAAAAAENSLNAASVRQWKLDTGDQRQLPEGKSQLGHSPSPDVILSRRSRGRSQSSNLPTFSEDGEGEELPPDNGSQQWSSHSGSVSPAGSRGGSNSAGSILGQSPTPAKLAEQRSASRERRASGGLPTFEEASEGESSSLGTTTDDESSPRQRREKQPVSSEDSSDEDPADNSSGQLQQNRRVLGGSSASLQWAGEAMSL